MKTVIAGTEFHPGFRNRARISARENGLKNPPKVHVIEMECQPGLKRQREHAQ